MVIESLSFRRKKIKKKAHTQFSFYYVSQILVIFIRINDQYTLSPISIGPQVQFPH